MFKNTFLFIKTKIIYLFEQRFALTNPWALLEILVVLPEEVNSRHLRLGLNRREDAIFQLKSSVPNVLKFLSVRFLINTTQNINRRDILHYWVSVLSKRRGNVLNE
jgi:hypothetical protein